MPARSAKHLEQTKGHVSRLERVFELLGHKSQAKKCDAKETDQKLTELAEADVNNSASAV